MRNSIPLLSSELFHNEVMRRLHAGKEASKEDRRHELEDNIAEINTVFKCFVSSHTQKHGCYPAWRQLGSNSMVRNKNHDYSAEKTKNGLLFQLIGV